MEPLSWPSLERGDATAVQTFCLELHSKRWTVIRLPEQAGREVEALRDAAATFFASPIVVKRAAGEGEDATYLGYRDSPKQGAEFLEVYLTPEGACYPHIVEPPELAVAAAALHIRLSRVGRTLLSHLAAHLRAPVSGLLAPLEEQTEEGLPARGPSSRLGQSNRDSRLLSVQRVYALLLLVCV